MTTPGSLGGTPSVTLDASFVIGLCAKEPGKYPTALAALRQRILAGYTLHAPHLLVMEVVYVLCNKLQSATLTPTEHLTALANLHSLVTMLIFPASGDAVLISRAEQIRQGYGCSRSADSFYIALAELLAIAGPSELLTFDRGQQMHAALPPGVTVILLTPSPDSEQSVS